MTSFFSRSKTIAHWYNHIGAIHAPLLLKPWLRERHSLTHTLRMRANQFHIELVCQEKRLCWADDYAPLALPPYTKTHVREVLLFCDNVPVIYGHTVLPLTPTDRDWPHFKHLGNRSLGSLLFADPLIKRAWVQFARLSNGHPGLMHVKQLCQHRLSSYVTSPVFARRALFLRKKACMLVTELFLPAIIDL